MKKTIFMLAAAAVVFAACSSDEAVKVNKGNEIAFRANMNWTRGADMTYANLDQFNVTAINATSGSTYINDRTYTRDASGTYTCADKAYWPESDALNFFAYAPIASNQISKANYKTFTVTPSTDFNAQTDLIYANTNGKTQADSQNGVSLNFRHAESKITVKVYNGNNMVRVYATTWEIGYLSPSGTFTYQDATTDGNNSGTLLNYADWSNWTPATAATEYFGGTTNISFENVVPAANAQAIPGEMILVPQQLVPATGYDSNNPNGAYIGVKLRIVNIDDNTVIYGGNDGAWAIWPVDTKWLPGKKYTYIIDLGDGGYKKIVPDGPLDPVLKEVKIINVTVDDWVDEAPIYLHK